MKKPVNTKRPPVHDPRSPVVIDGSFGEGGGQILRTALSLSCVTGRQLRLFNIRKRRKQPGLMPQHMTCVHAAARICGAKISGNEKGSRELEFTPGKTVPGEYVFDIGTAGSCSLVIQTLIPPLIFTDSDSGVTVTGGTHVPFSPPYDYMSDVFLPVLDTCGIHVESSIQKYGFYPKGGGNVSFRIFPAEKITELNCLSRGQMLSLRGYSGVSRLPASIAERQRNSVRKILPEAEDIEIIDAPAQSAGTFVFLKAEYEHCVAGFSSLGMRGKPAELVGREAAESFREFHNTNACLDPHLADQLVIYLGLAGKSSSFTTSRITQHLATNLMVIQKFLGTSYRINGKMNSPGKVTINPKI